MELAFCVKGLQLHKAPCAAEDILSGFQNAYRKPRLKDSRSFLLVIMYKSHCSKQNNNEPECYEW